MWGRAGHPENAIRHHHLPPRVWVGSGPSTEAPYGVPPYPMPGPGGAPTGGEDPMPDDGGTAVPDVGPREPGSGEPSDDPAFGAGG